ncbi:MAG: hypothetical protein NVSMB29_10480 [Candidatus Dormibacteria bacterium]
MSALAIGAYWASTALAGFVVLGLVRAPLRLEERVAIGLVCGLIAGPMLTLACAAVVGLGLVACLGGPLLLALAGAALAAALLIDPRTAWRQSWGLTREQPWRGRMAVVGVAAALFAVVFAHTLRSESGALLAGFETVWADWSLHATTASSFVHGHPLPPDNPLLSGTPLRYPYLPDLQSAVLLVLGSDMGAALAVPGYLLCVAISALVVSLGQRVTGSTGAAAIALAVCVLGGGLGFVGVAADACNRAAPAQACSISALRAEPLRLPAAAAAVLDGLPGAVADQRRAYDGLITPDAQKPLPNMQWYTPLLAWWLPQRSFLFGFAAGLSVLTLVVVALGEGRRAWASFALAGLLAGSLPFVHVHTLIALAMVLPLMALRRPRREWWVLLGLAVVLAVPRLLALAGGPHGTEAVCNTFPWLDPGWMSGVIATVPGATCNHTPITLRSLAGLPLQALRVGVDWHFWGFWVLNCGLLVPLSALAAAGLGLRRLPQPRLRAAGERLVGAFGTDVVRFARPLLVVFVVANTVVFQSWEWDNTKLFVWWQFGAALLAGAWARRWWGAGRWRQLAAGAGVASLVLTGTLVMLRYLPWTPRADAVGGPYAMLSASDARLAADLDARTAPGSVVLTSQGVTDPALVGAGRTAFLGYYGWLWSYGTDFGNRLGDEVTMYAGCPGQKNASCEALRLMRTYGIDYAEIRDDQPVGGQPPPNPSWWAAHFPVVASGDHVVVYDVRGR